MEDVYPVLFELKILEYLNLVVYKTNVMSLRIWLIVYAKITSVVSCIIGNPVPDGFPILILLCITASVASFIWGHYCVEAGLNVNAQFHCQKFCLEGHPIIKSTYQKNKKSINSVKELINISSP